MDFKKLLDIVKETRFDNKPEEVVYYADGRYFNKNFMVYEYDPYAIGYKITWWQSGFRSVAELKYFKDFQERV